jgi:hypothetical protein
VGTPSKIGCNSRTGSEGFVVVEYNSSTGRAAAVEPCKAIDRMGVCIEVRTSTPGPRSPERFPTAPTTMKLSDAQAAVVLAAYGDERWPGVAGQTSGRRDDTDTTRPRRTPSFPVRATRPTRPVHFHPSPCLRSDRCVLID